MGNHNLILPFFFFFSDQRIQSHRVDFVHFVDSRVSDLFLVQFHIKNKAKKTHYDSLAQKSVIK